MAQSRSPLVVGALAAAMMRSISSVERMSGRWRPNLGMSMNSAGDAEILSVTSRNAKKLRMPLSPRACEVFSRPLR